jgi:hypothetical protein
VVEVHDASLVQQPATDCHGNWEIENCCDTHDTTVVVLSFVCCMGLCLCCSIQCWNGTAKVVDSLESTTETVSVGNREESDGLPEQAAQDTLDIVAMLDCATVSLACLQWLDSLAEIKCVVIVSVATPALDCWLVRDTGDEENHCVGDAFRPVSIVRTISTTAR